jgi:hypothetical protein
MKRMEKESLLRSKDPGKLFFKGCETDADRFYKLGAFAADVFEWIVEEDQIRRNLLKEVRELRAELRGNQ